MLTKLKQIASFNEGVTRRPQDDPQWLPGSLSSRILDLEFQCEEQKISKELISQLQELYSKALEYYEEMGSDKFKIYQKRMYHFLKKTAVAEILKGKSGQLVIKKENNEIKLLKETEHSHEVAQKMIKTSTEAAQKNIKTINSELKSQEQKLEQRIGKRRTMSNRSTKTGPEIEDFGDEIDYNPLKEKDKKLQDIMSMKLILDGIKQRSSKRVFM